MNGLEKYGFLFEPKKEELPEIVLHDRVVPAGTWTDVPSDAGALKMQREALGYTQQEVADMAHIDVRQYQRFESGERRIEQSSFRIGLNVCHVLKIDPMFYCDIRDMDS